MKKIVFLFSFALLVMSCMQTDATNKELTAIEYYNRGVVYVDLGKYQLALDDYSSAIRINPDYAKAYNNRGGVYVDLGKYQLALDDYSSAIRINPDDAKAYDNRGIVKWHLKLEYCNDFKRACDLGQCDNYNKGCKWIALWSLLWKEKGENKTNWKVTLLTLTTRQIHKSQS